MTEYLKFFGQWNSDIFGWVLSPPIVCVRGKYLIWMISYICHFCLKASAVSQVCWKMHLPHFFQVSFSSGSKFFTLQFYCHVKVSSVFFPDENGRTWCLLQESLPWRESVKSEGGDCHRGVETVCLNCPDWDFKSVCLLSDNDKAGGKHCTVWAATARNFTSERELLCSPAKSDGVYSSNRSTWLGSSERLWWV